MREGCRALVKSKERSWAGQGGGQGVTEGSRAGQGASSGGPVGTGCARATQGRGNPRLGLWLPKVNRDRGSILFWPCSIGAFWNRMQAWGLQPEVKAPAAALPGETQTASQRSRAGPGPGGSPALMAPHVLFPPFQLKACSRPAASLQGPRLSPPWTPLFSCPGHN